MNYQNFLDSVVAAIQKRIPTDWEVSIQPFSKNNGVIYDGLTIRRPEINISPVIYLNPYYHRYLDGVSLTDIHNDIYSAYLNMMAEKIENVDKIFDYAQTKNRIILKLINHQKNSEYLNNVPHIDYLDFAIVFLIYMAEDKDGYAAITVTNHLMENWKITVDELYDLAKKNTPRLFPYRFQNIESIFLNQQTIDEFSELCPLRPEMYMLTNNSKTNGATVILYTELLADIAESFGSDLILLPSSIHEFLVVPDTSIPMDFYSQLVQEVNETAVHDCEYLSDHAYYFSLKHKRLSMSN